MRRLLAALLLVFACKAEDPPVERPKCNYHADCANDGVCQLGECYPTVSCFERSHCAQVPICADNHCFCDEDINRCIPVCITDNDCPSDGYCLDGVCTPHPVVFDGMALPSGPRDRLMVGLARIPLDFPMGVSMAGYGSRIGPRTPYQDSLGGSNAWFDRPDVRAIVFSDGKETAILLRISTSWSTDFMFAEIARKVQERTGINVLDNLITTANHSHSLPARFWHLVEGFGFGFFGYDEFSYEVFDRMTTSYAEAVVMALDDMRPARFGYVVLDDFDPEGKIHRDRRDRNDNLPGYIGKDDRMILMRVDDDAGEPVAFLSNFGMHGTVFDYDNPVLTGDAGSGVEVMLTELASAKYGRPVMGFYLQGNAGDISPGGDDLGHNNFERLQLLGHRAFEVMEPEMDQIATSADTKVSIFGSRVPISHAHLGYAPGEFYDADVKCDGSADYFRYGAFQCVEGYFEDDDPSTKFEDGDLACVFGIECLTGGYPVPEFQKTNLSILRLGTLALPTMPGEPLSQFGRDLSERIIETVPEIQDAAVLGYAQDHHFYLLNEDDWLQGGYEASRDIWGWRLAPYLVENTLLLAEELIKEPEERVFAPKGNVKPMYWVDSEEVRRPVPFTETEGDPAQVIEPVPDEVELLDEVTLAWSGGHPGLDLPHVVLEREDGGTFSPVQKPGGLTYDDSGFEMLVIYEGTCTRRQCEAHRWRVRWQEDRSFPLGRYRFAIEGMAYKNGQPVSYTISSSAFEIVPSSKLAISELSATSSGLAGKASEPALENAFVLRSMTTPGSTGAALSGDVTFRGQVGAQAIDDTATIASDGSFALPVAAIAGGPAGDYFVELTLTDGDGNSGTITATVTK